MIQTELAKMVSPKQMNMTRQNSVGAERLRMIAFTISYQADPKQLIRTALGCKRPRRSRVSVWYASRGCNPPGDPIRQFGSHKTIDIEHPNMAQISRVKKTLLGSGLYPTNAAHSLKPALR